MNKRYKVEFTNRAKKELKKLDKYTSLTIISWIKKNLENCKNPYQHGKGLIGNHSGQWRYRIGNYRLICEIQESKIIILVLNVGHRREIYN